MNLYAAVLAAMLTAAPAFSADEINHGNLVLIAPFTFESPPSQKSTGGYLEIRNTGATDDVLVSATSPFPKTELHLSVTDDKGIASMQHQHDGIVVPAGGIVMLKPGGYHVMFMGVAEQPAAGDTIPVSLVFRDAGAVEVDFLVRKRGGKHGHHSSHSDNGS